MARATTVLCLEDRESLFGASHEIFASGEYRVITATSAGNALTALKAVPAITLAVIARTPREEQLRIADEIESIRPGLPKVFIDNPTVAPIPQEQRLGLRVFYVETIQALVEKIGLIIAASRAEREKRAALLERSRELIAETRGLRNESKRLRKETRAHMEQVLEKAHILPKKNQ